MPRAGLTRAIVTETAADLADESGWERLTLAAVAARLAVRQPSLYKHVDSLAALRRAVSLLAVTQLGERLVLAVAGRSGGDALRHLARAYREYAHAYPGRYAASVVAPAPGDVRHAQVGAAIVATLAAVLRGYGIDGTPAPGGDGRPGGTGPSPDALHAIRALRAVLHGFVALEAAGGFALALDLDESYRRLVDAFDGALRRQSDEAALRRQSDDAAGQGTRS